MASEIIGRAASRDLLDLTHSRMDDPDHTMHVLAARHALDQLKKHPGNVTHMYKLELESRLERPAQAATVSAFLWPLWYLFWSLWYFLAVFWAILAIFLAVFDASRFLPQGLSAKQKGKNLPPQPAKREK